MPVRLTTCSKGGKKYSRSTRSEMEAGPILVPLSGWPWPVRCLSVANTFPGANVVTLAVPCKPSTAATPNSAVRYGSSPKVSSIRPQRGSRATSTTGDNARLTPRARISRPMTTLISRIKSGSHDEARAIACGKLVASSAAYPCKPSSCINIGMPSRVWVIACVCSALTRRTVPRTSRPLTLRGDAGPKASDGRAN